MASLPRVVRTVSMLTSGMAATMVAVPTVWALASINSSSRTVDRVIRWWARVFLRTSGTTLVVEGADTVDTTRSYIVVANHLSMIDIMAGFAAIPLPIRYLAKKELFSVPFLAQAMRAIGIVEVDRGGRAAAIESVNRQAKPVMERGHSLIIYPEGTRSRDGNLRPFKKGAFMMAIASGLPVLPVAIHGTREVKAPGSVWVNPGRTVTVRIGTTLETAGLARSDIDELRNRAHAQIAEALSEVTVQS